MKRRLASISTVLITFIIIAYFVNMNEDLDNDISNLPPSINPKFVKLTEENMVELSTRSLSTEDYSKLININFTFKILPLVCQNSAPLVLIVIHSAPKNFERRNTIRHTWAANPNTTKLLFMLGSVNPDKEDQEELNNEISEESLNFQDIVQGSFIDSYENLTYKHMMAFKYTIYHCNRIKFVLKSDDDVFVNTQYLLNYINSTVSEHGASKLLMCNLWDHAAVRRSFRSKYRVSFEQYHPSTFPTYCSGWFILYSPDVVLDLYKQAQSAEYFWIDDVFLTGIMVQNLDISHFNIRNHVISRYQMERILNGNCDERSAQFILGRPNIQTDTILTLWRCVEKWSQNRLKYLK